MKVIALLQARNEERFIRGWLENIAPAVDGIVALDDGSTDDTYNILASHAKTLEVIRNPVGRDWNEYLNHISLIKAGRRHGATWFLCIDADERIEERLCTDISMLVRDANDKKIDAYAFHLRDLWNDRFHYRSDGLWANKAVYRLFRNVNSHSKFDPRRLHRYWLPFEILADIGNVGKSIPYAIYHLKMISSKDRLARYERYTRIDSANRLQQQGYEYLIDEKGIELLPVSPDRDFLPKNDPSVC